MLVREIDGPLTVVMGRTGGSRACNKLARLPSQSRAPLHDAAVGENGRRGDMAGPFASEEGNDAADLRGLRHTPQGDCIVEFPEQRGVVRRRAIDRCGGCALTDVDDEELDEEERLANKRLFVDEDVIFFFKNVYNNFFF